MNFIGYGVVNETEKAVAIPSEIYLKAKETANYDVKELTSEEIFALKNNIKVVWLPKSQITIKNGRVIEIADWLAKKNNLLTKSFVEKILSNEKNTEEVKKNLINTLIEKGLLI